MKEFLQLTIAGAATGAIYSLMAAGLTVSYSATGIFNLAYGAIAFCAALLYYELNTGLGWPIVPAFVAVVFVFCPLLGLGLNLAVFRPLARATDAAKIMATVGLLVALPAIARYIVEGGISTFGWGIPDAKQVTLPPGIFRSPPSVSHLFFDVTLNSNQIVVFIVAAIVAVLLWFLLRRTRLGLQMRAVVDKPELANLRGIDDGRTSAYAWVIGTMLAGLAGVVGAPVINNLQADQFNIVMFIAVAAVVLGGMRSVPGAFVGGLVIGVAEVLAGRYMRFMERISIFANGGFKNSVPFLLLLIGLVFLGRDRSRRAGSVSSTPPPIDWTSDLPRWRVRLPWMIAVVAFLVWTFFIVDEFWLGNFATGLAYGVVFLSFVIVTGNGGMVSLAQATFVTVAAMVAGRLLIMNGWPWAAALVAGMVIAMVLGIIVSLPALRLGGLQLALATLALGFIGDRVLFKWEWLRHGQSGWRITKPVIGPLDFRNRPTMIVFLMIVLAAITWLITNLQKSSTGRAITAVRNSESAAATSGISIPRTKLAIFALSAAVAGFGGVLVATNNGNISDGTFVTQAGLAWLAAVVLFGIRRPQGAIIAGLVTACSTPIFTNGWHFAFFPTFLHWNGLGSSTATYVANALFGMGAVQLAREPDGVLAITAAQNRARRDKRRAKREAREDRPTIDRSTIDLTKTTVDPSDETEPMTPTTLAAAASSGATHHINSSHDASSTTAAARADDAVLRLDDVRSGYGLVEVLHGVSLDVRAGEITTILGPNGAGKSTLCQTIAGLVAVRSGTVVHRGHDVGSLRAHQRSKRGIVLAPESRGVFAGLTVRENLQMWLPDADERDSAYDRFPILGERRNLPAGSLSGGEQQMLTLAPLLVRPPDVLVADEPSLGLAPLIVEQILQIFVELRDRGVALVLVEEKARGVLDIADSVSFISLGHMLWSGPRVDVDEELLAQAYLGHVRV